MKKLIISTITALLIFTACSKEEEKKVDNTPVQSFPSVVMSNQSSSSYNCFLTFDSCKVRTIVQAEANQNTTDLVFLHNNPDNLAMFVSPASISGAVTIPPDLLNIPTIGITNWTSKNSMQIGVTDITVGGFNSIATNSDLHNAYENDPHVTIGWEIDIKPNKVYKFTSNRTGKRGLIKVNSINGNYSTAGQINMDIKMIN